MIFAERESTICLMSDFKPFIVTESSSFLKHVGHKDYAVGEKYGVLGNAIVIATDNNETTICYTKSEGNCAKCPEECPFSTNPNRKEA